MLLSNLRTFFLSCFANSQPEFFTEFPFKNEEEKESVKCEE